ncbi:NatA N-acetyltransferase subunit Naa50 [Schizosaccharomyces pombe]|uniref:Uncharacterized N-acetyltransferase C663.13c n=1 Tax=Schizosaccharomyces pombe (strain 972 / ATCC 24843) TaxID=284812 RepID=YCPD_SCHPO|nr:putative NatA N-acetyltransferase subunit Naa50 [Schizosaccharomyces pombe]O74519.1 RecName: Full=Uncharacterized N-acetyltransferase C663.13c [Schizosaccharomyces pombe 972h-]CAA20373.1 NatA N-acetyltransferase subunit Naa50 (predicted) [Schizosaccharomyces pombe]|eukprot:NP_588274.1 putative NatA N-acetyltransferase subunit Naa50 [Schizosaccharomyces pombe]
MIELDAINPNNLKILEVINEKCFDPEIIIFPTSFYKDTISVGPLAQYAYFNQVCVGAVRCKKETHNKSHKIQILSLAVLPAYRNRSIGTKLLEYACETAAEGKAKEIYIKLSPKLDVSEWFIHRGFIIDESSKTEDSVLLSKKL